MINQTKKAALVEHIKEREKSAENEILLPPDLYFDGYDDDQCTVCANVSISTAAFQAVLHEIAERPEVAAIFVRFYDYADALESENAWIGSDSVYLLTSASLDTVGRWFSELEPADLWEEDPYKFAELPEVPNGFRLVAVWWD